MILVSLSLWKKIIRKWRQSMALGAIWKQNRLKIKHWSMRINKRSSGGRKRNRQQFIFIRSWSSSFSLIIYQRNYIRSSNIRNTNLKTSNVQICKWLIQHSHLTFWAAIITLLHRRPVRIMHIIHAYTCIHLLWNTCTLIVLICIVKLYRYSVTNIQN